MDQIQSSPNNKSSAPSGTKIHKYPMTILQSHEPISNSMEAFKEDVDQLKLTTKFPMHVYFKLSKAKTATQEPKSQTERPKISQKHAKSEPPPSILTPKKTSKPNSTKKLVAKPSPTYKCDALQLQGKEILPDFKVVKVCKNFFISFTKYSYN
ncbi:hypothetical protein O181_034203 [Austropuccinia psidii MF-1]|uniref:Uncharacterized protein n=1 Tax=Austropuccinia psidii MF-1 TaxID=1389203 RepID=A0A9Q3D503_9BASI|nr:hypothetical protein [Austropuccinia psidii MF-1]